MITLQIENGNYKYTVLSDTPDLEDIGVHVNPDDGMMTLMQYETMNDDAEDFQLIRLTPRLAYALFGILKATICEAGSGDDVE